METDEFGRTHPISTRTVTRRHREKPTVPVWSTYRESFEREDLGSMTKRCVAARHATKLNDLIKGAIHAVPLESVREMKYGDSTSSTRPLESTAAASTASAASTTATATDYATRARIERRDADSAGDPAGLFDEVAAISVEKTVTAPKPAGAGGIKSLFSESTDGARSESGEKAAMQYFQSTRPLEGSVQVFKPSETTVTGARFK